MTRGKKSVTTKGGDRGKTSLREGVRTSKTGVTPEALGTIDELNACLGVVRASAEDEILKNRILRIQNYLFVAGAELATPRGNELKPRIEKQAIEDLERIQKELEAILELPAKFVIYGGTALSASLDLARAVARRAERAVLKTFEKEGTPNPNLPVFLNRLSDLLYILARNEDRKAGATPAHPDYVQGVSRKH
ncbi:cob(I)yrinic acid a,c-diamide adenosyltransferase [Acidobacteriota bacterium]